ncbi:MAG TPA: hypothetical protein VFX21_10520 [Acidimicrobiia bacterium]|nr:hypothetical protein [Acidimicrobiia bacterium]
MEQRYRCNGCGNLTRFDVVAVRRTRAFHHYTIGGDLEIAEEEVLEEQVESVTCRWCGAAGAAIETLPADALGAEQLHDQAT